MQDWKLYLVPSVRRSAIGWPDRLLGRCVLGRAFLSVGILKAARAGGDWRSLRYNLEMKVGVLRCKNAHQALLSLRG